MNRRSFTFGAALIAAAAVTSRAAGSNHATGEPLTDHEATIRALRPPKRERPVIAVVMDERGSETTDTLVPFGVFAHSGLAEVHLLSAADRPVDLFPALKVRPTLTLEAFDRQHPDGPDYLIVPASHRIESPSLVPWIARHHAGGAIIAGVCAGAKTVAAAGLLDGREGTTHWYELDGLRDLAPDMRWRRDRRYVVDDRVVTTTGVTASIPVSMAIVEAIAGPQHASALGRELGVQDWSARHDSDAFAVSRAAITTGLAGRMAFWNRKSVAVRVEPGVSEIALALTADAWSRTYRSAAFAVSSSAEVTTRHGLQILVERAPSERFDIEARLPAETPATALDLALADIEQAFGRRVASFVALQLEYPSDLIGQG